MPYRYSLLLLISALYLSACANKPAPGEGASTKFTTNIKSDGSKRFVFVMVNQKGKSSGNKDGSKRGGNKGDGGGPSGKGKGGKGQSGGNRNSQNETSWQGSGRELEDDREIVVALLENEITASGYCRHGYIELDYSQMRDKTEIVGECQESASNEDKERWD